MANYRFSASVDKWITDSKKRTDAVFKQSIHDLINDAQTPTGQGGRMRVDTGFLRASGQISLTGMPSGPARGEPGTVHNYRDDVTATLAGAEPGATVYFGWSANYAKYRELYDGFLGAAVQNWQTIVARNVRRLQARAAFRSSGGGER